MDSSYLLIHKDSSRWLRQRHGALSKRLEYGPGTGSARGTLLAGLRYEYDGLNVLRVDELYDNDTGGLETNDAWRAREANTHRPGSLGALLAKRVYDYPSATSGRRTTGPRKIALR